MHCVHVWCTLRSVEAIRVPQTGVRNGYDLPCGFWKLNLCSLQEKEVLVLYHWALTPASGKEFNLNFFLEAVL